MFICLECEAKLNSLPLSLCLGLKWLPRKTVAIPPMHAQKRIRRNLTVIEINLLDTPCPSPKEEERRKYPWKG